MNTESNNYTFQVTSPAKLTVRNIRGQVELVPGAEDEIKIEVITYLDDGNPDHTHIEITQHDDGEVEAVVRIPENSFGFIHCKPLRVDFKIEAPAQTNIKVKNISGDIHAQGFTGKQRLATVSGALHLHDLSGDLNLDSVSGAIKGKRLSGKGDISVVSGRMILTECDFSTLKGSTVSGSAQVQTDFAEGPYKLTAVSGSVTLVVPENSDCDASASAVSGRFYTDLNVSQSKVSKRSWKVRIGQGGPEVKLSTVSGNMRLLSSFDATGSVPGEVHISEETRKGILNRLQDGEISVEDALKELG